MTQDPASPSPAGGSADDALEATQPVDVPHFAPTPDPRPDTRWAWAASESRPAGSGWASAEASGQAPAWATVNTRPAFGGGSGSSATPPRTPGTPRPAGAAWGAAASSATTAWPGGAAPEAPSPGTPAAVPPTWVAPVVRTGRERRPGIGTVAAVALLSAILASTGTVLAFQQSGAFDAAAAAATPPTTGGGAVAGTGGGAGAAAPGAVGDDSSAVISSAAKVSPAVVKITTSGATTDPFSSNQTSGVGSGIIYDAGGWIVTNHHVVNGADTLTVELKDGRSFKGTVYGIDTLTDLAIVKVDATGLPAAALGLSDGLKVGQLVIAVGSPLGTYSFSVTSGIVSGKGRSIVVNDGSPTGATISNLIQTDAAINAGNSGGPLADADGKVVGINTAVVDGSNGIGFAIPIDIAKPIMSQAVKGEKLERPWIGIVFQSINQRIKQAQNLTVDSGALITNAGGTGPAVQPNSPAETAGLKDGDVVTAINGIAIDQEHPLNLLLVQFAPKDTVQLTVLRGGQTLTIPVTLGVRPANLN